MQKIFMGVICISMLGLTACDKKAEPVVENSQLTTTSNEPNTATKIASITPKVQTSTTENLETTISTPSTGLSRDHAQDIADDLKAMWAATSQAKLDADQSMMSLKTALDKNNQMLLKQALEETNQSILKLNRQYDAVTLKSSEVTAARERLKEHNVMQYELGKMITAPVPDQTAFNAHLEKYSQMKKMIDLEMQTLTQKASVSQ